MSLTSLLAQEVRHQTAEAVRLLDRRHVRAPPEHVQTHIGQALEQRKGR